MCCCSAENCSDSPFHCSADRVGFHGPQDPFASQARAKSKAGSNILHQQRLGVNLRFAVDMMELKRLTIVTGTDLCSTRSAHYHSQLVVKRTAECRILCLFCPSFLRGPCFSSTANLTGPPSSECAKLASFPERGPLELRCTCKGALPRVFQAACPSLRLFPAGSLPLLLDPSGSLLHNSVK